MAPASGVFIVFHILRPSRAEAVFGPLYPRYFRDMYCTNDIHHGVEGPALRPPAAWYSRILCGSLDSEIPSSPRILDSADCNKSGVCGKFSEHTHIGSTGPPMSSNPPT